MVRRGAGQQLVVQRMERGMVTVHRLNEGESKVQGQGRRQRSTVGGLEGRKVNNSLWSAGSSPRWISCPTHA